MSRMVLWVLPLAVLFFLFLQWRWPLRKFPQRIVRKNLAFHLIFSGLIAFEVWALSRWSLLPTKTSFSVPLGDLPPAAQILLCFVVLDLFSYCWHRMNHRLKFLWRFHAFHHKTETLDPLAAYRFHPVEIFMGYQLRALVVLLVGLRPETVALFVVVYGVMNVFQHSNWRLPAKVDDALSLVFVTPARHHVHHLRQREFQHSNFSTVFMFWDRLFGSYRSPIEVHPGDLGLDEESEKL